MRQFFLRVPRAALASPPSKEVSVSARNSLQSFPGYVVRDVVWYASAMDLLADTRLRVKPTKTRRGKRNIALSAEAVAMLREHRKEQLELRLALGQGGQPTLVFSTIEGDYLKPNSISRSWRQACKARKLPRVAFHSLRHCHASALIRVGVDILTISRRLGHSKAAMTLDVLRALDRRLGRCRREGYRGDAHIATATLRAKQCHYAPGGLTLRDKWRDKC